MVDHFLNGPKEATLAVSETATEEETGDEAEQRAGEQRHNAKASVGLLVHFAVGILVNERWLGGMLTNFRTIESRIARLKAIETMSEDGTFDVLPKKEVIALKKEWEKLEKNLGGIKDMKRIPDAIFVVDPKKERICIKEAQALGITLIGIADTNCDPDELDYVIPGNDDAIRAVKLIVSKMADAVIEAKQGAEEEVTAEEASDETVEE